MNKNTKDKHPRKKFGDVVTADHLVSKSERSIAYDGSKYAVVMYDWD